MTGPFTSAQRAAVPLWVQLVGVPIGGAIAAFFGWLL